MQIESAETDPSASVGDCYYMAAVNTIQEVNYLLPVAWTSLKNSRTFHSGTPNCEHRNSIRSWIICPPQICLPPFVLMVVPLWMEEWKSWKMPNKMTSNLIILQSQAKVNLHPQTQWLLMLLKSIFFWDLCQAMSPSGCPPK